MKFARGDIWDWSERGIPIVIPVNIGWNAKGHNIMGRGLARQAAQRYPVLPRFLGLKCTAAREMTPVVWWQQEHTSLLLFPVKPLNFERPWLSWQSDASLALIERSTEQLSRLVAKHSLGMVALPLVGCGNGKLQRSEVLPILEAHLGDDFTLVE